MRVGPFADRPIKTLNADVLLLGVHGVDTEAGLTTPNVAEAETEVSWAPPRPGIVPLAHQHAG